METQLNSITLKGVVGAIRSQEIYGKKIYRMSVSTSYAYVSVENGPVIEMVWNNVCAFESKSVDPQLWTPLQKVAA